MDAQYLALLDDVLTNGVRREDRTGTGTLAVFGRMVRHNLADGFPILTTKKVNFHGAVIELLWFLRGESNIDFLKAHGVGIWDAWAGDGSSVGPIYGPQWRAWQGPDGTAFDQVHALIDGIRARPHSRRHILSAWNVAYLPDESISPEENVRAGRMALAPCPTLYQFFVVDGKLSCMLTQRSADLLLGVPWNEIELALLTHMIAQQCDLEPGEIIHSFGDLHLYLNHLDQAREQLARAPRALPKLVINRRPPSIFDYDIEDFALDGYDPHPVIRAPISK